MVRRSPFFSTLATFNRSTSAEINQAKVDSIPYATVMAWFEGNARALLVLGDYLPNERLVWYSAERQALTTWGPFALALVGTEVALRSTTMGGEWESDVRRLVGRTLTRTQDYEAPSSSARVAMTSKFTDEGLDEVKILDKRMTLRRIREHVVASGWHHYRNDYWIEEASGFCWRSSQVLVPTLPRFNIAVTKPAILPNN